MSESRIKLKLHPKQIRAFESDATEILYGGAAGGGKSHLMRVAAIIWCSSIRGLNVYIFRRISDDLIKNHIEGRNGFRALLAPWVESGIVEIVEGEIRFKLTGSKIFLCHCKDEKDRFKYQGAEIDVLFIDELTHFSEVIYNFLRSRVRSVGLEVPSNIKGQFPRIICGSNPGNIGHTWVKAEFIDDCVPYKIRHMADEHGGMLRQFIPALLSDNPSMEEDDPRYRSRIMGMGKKLSRMFLDGDWNVIEGAFFDEFGLPHIVKPITLPAHWLRFSSYDHGSARPFSHGWWAVSDGTLSQFPKGSLIRYREWYGASGPNKGLKMPIPQIATGILSKELPNEKIIYRVADPSIFAEDGGQSDAQLFAENGVVFIRADNKRVSGWQRIRDRLAIQSDGLPRLFVFDTNYSFLKLFPALQHDEKIPEDVDTDMEDHLGDEARYGVNSRPYTIELEVGKPVKFIQDMSLDELWDTEGAYEASNRI